MNGYLKTSALSACLLAVMGLSACEVVLVESGASQDIRSAQALGASPDNVQQAEALFRNAIPAARDAKTRAIAQYELGRLLTSTGNNRARRAEGLAFLQSAAEIYPPAQNKLGQLFADGQGVRKNIEQASQYFRAAASAGHTGAQINLARLIAENPSVGTAAEASQLASAGVASLEADSRQGNANASRKLGQIYRDGIVVQQDAARSEQYLSRAVEQGQANAVADLARLWIEGNSRDQQRALRLLQMGADRDVTRAIILLGDLYRDGTITDRDLDRALSYYLQSASGFDRSTVSRVASTLRGRLSAARRQEGMDYLRRASAAGSPYAALALGKISEAAANYRSAASYYRAAGGLAEAKLRLGRLYFDGNGVEQNYSKAIELLRAADAGGQSAAAVYLGRAYAEGKGVAINWATARTYLERAYASQKSVTAANLLAKAHAEGLGGPVDLIAAFRLYKFAAEHGSIHAMQALASAYRLGQGTRQNDREAYKWTQRAAESGSVSALIENGFAYFIGRGVPRDLAQSGTYFEQAVALDPAAAGRIARAFTNGSHGVQNPEQASYWNGIAARSGDAQAIRTNAQNLELRDPAQAEAAYRLAAASGDHVAMARLADLAFARGDSTAAVAWLDKAASAGSGASALQLGKLYAFGDGVTANLQRAFQYYIMGAQLGNGEAMFWVSMSYRQGLGVTQNTATADEWQQRARAAGYTG